MIFQFNAGEVFKIALMIEDNGHLFYEEMAAKPFPPEIAKIFKDLAKEELGHKSMFNKLLEKLPPVTTASTVWDPDNELDGYLKLMAGMHVFNKEPADIAALGKSISTPAEAVRMAMGFEKDTIVFFLEIQALSERYDETRQEIDKLVAAERTHLKNLTNLLERIEGRA
ncbi:MAG: ferritin family protein [Candidatus Adiutrix sp.]|jgi:rubrerythrin|nr:ferritin family protein [Candidatus Adiutrix sp.]